jgi:hypothetical protein
MILFNGIKDCIQVGPRDSSSRLIVKFFENYMGGGFFSNWIRYLHPRITHNDCSYGNGYGA